MHNKKAGTITYLLFKAISKCRSRIVCRYLTAARLSRWHIVARVPDAINARSAVYDLFCPEFREIEIAELMGQFLSENSVLIISHLLSPAPPSVVFPCAGVYTIRQFSKRPIWLIIQNIIRSVPNVVRTGRAVVFSGNGISIIIKTLRQLIVNITRIVLIKIGKYDPPGKIFNPFS
jgi:hypothetical protein